MSQLDVYRDWLGITDTDRPLNYYQLLRLKKFEDDTEKIRANYRKLNAAARKYAAGQYGAQSQQLLNELAKAMLCLTDATRKAEYDATLGRKEEAKLGRTLEEILIRRKLVDSAQLAKARNYSNAVGVEVREAIVQQKMATQEAVMQAYAESVGVSFIDLTDIGIDASLVPQVPALLARQHSCAPVMIDDGVLLLVSPNLIPPEVEEELRLRLGVTVRTVLCTPAQIHAVIDQHFPKEAAEAELARGTAKGKAAKSAGKSTDKTAKNGPKEENPYQAPQESKAEEASSDGSNASQRKQMTAAIVGIIVFVAAAVVLNFVTPFASEQLGIGPLGGATAAGAGLVAAGIAYLFA